MVKFFQIVIVLAYVLLTIFAFLLVLAISGVYISNIAALLIIFGWLIFCACSSYFRTPITIFFHFKLRKPILEEEEKLSRCFHEVLERSQCKKTFRLRIDETPGLSAFAIGHNTIAVSRNLLMWFNEEELKGVLAHELGHLVSRDSVTLSAFVMASDLPRWVSKIFRLSKKGVLASMAIALRVSLLLGLVLFFVIGYFLNKWHLIMPVIAVAAFILLFTLLDRIFEFLRLVVSRYTEYKQDAYAHQLGYGPSLREALKKLTLAGPQSVNSYSILMNGTHPMIYNRIRRLEKLSGMRDHNFGVTGL